MAYSAVVYVRFKEESYYTKLIASKTKVAPIKLMTIPRLELPGCLLLMNSVITNTKDVDVNIQSSFYWIDSKICIDWIQK